MAVDMFINLDGIPGESVDAGHAGECDIVAWSWGVTQSGSMHIGGGGGSGKAAFGDVSVTKYVDLSSMALLKKCGNGTHIAEAKLTVRKAGTDALEYMILTMTDCIITSYSTGGGGGEDRLTDSFSLNFRSYNFDYTEQTAQGGAGGTANSARDLATGQDI